VIGTKLEVAKILGVAPGEIDHVMSRLPASISSDQNQNPTAENEYSSFREGSFDAFRTRSRPKYLTEPPFRNTCMGESRKDQPSRT
jgi:hypothetical protein